MSLARALTRARRSSDGKADARRFIGVLKQRRRVLAFDAGEGEFLSPLGQPPAANPVLAHREGEDEADAVIRARLEPRAEKVRHRVEQVGRGAGHGGQPKRVGGENADAARAEQLHDCGADVRPAQIERREPPALVPPRPADERGAHGDGARAPVKPRAHLGVKILDERAGVKGGGEGGVRDFVLASARQASANDMTTVSPKYPRIPDFVLIPS